MARVPVTLDRDQRQSLARPNLDHMIGNGDGGGGDGEGDGDDGVDGLYLTMRS